MAALIAECQPNLIIRMFFISWERFYRNLSKPLTGKPIFQMNFHPVILVAALLGVVGGSRSFGQTLDWGSEVFSDLVDSKGVTLDNSFVFQLGAFVDGFLPDQTNTGSWLANWRVFDQASYNPDYGYFSSTVQMNDDGSSTSSDRSPGTMSFEGLGAYLWVRNGDDPEAGIEWLLTRADSWVFPSAVPGCCDNGTPLQWSVSDLDGSDVPVWGSQNGVNGAGEFVATGPYTLQTYTFVPEPSSALLGLLSGGLLLMRRRRFSTAL